MIVRRLDRYVTTHFLFSWLVWLFFMVGLMVVFDIFGKMDKFAEAASRLPEENVFLAVVQFYLVNSVFIMLQILPFVTVTAAMFTVTKLLKCNEIAPMIATGTSFFRILAPVFLGAVLAAGAMAALRETALPILRPVKERLELLALRGEQEKVRSGLFFTDPAGRLISVDRYFAVSHRIKGFKVIALGRMKDDWERWEAEEAVWTEEGGRRGWRLVGGKRLHPDGVGATVTEEKSFFPAGELEPAYFEQEINKNREFFDFSFSELAELARLRPDYPNFRVLLHYHVTFPLANILLLLLALPFGISFERRSTLEGVIMAIFICGLYVVLDISLRNLGGARVLNPVLASWAVPIVFGSAGVVLFSSIRT